MKTGTDNPGANEAVVDPTFLKVCFVPHWVNKLQVPVNTDQMKKSDFGRLLGYVNKFSFFLFFDSSNL